MNIFKKKILILIILSGFWQVALYAEYKNLPSSASRYFSPNLDGRQDSISIPLIIKDDFLEKWKVSIYEKKGKDYRLIRIYDSVNAKEITNLTGKKFIKRIFARDSPVAIPKNVSWDGYTKIPIKDKKNEIFGNSKVFNSSKVKDGVYYYRVTAIDEAGNTSRSSLVPICVDTVTPTMKLNKLEAIFSPNQDGNKDTLLFAFDLNDFQMPSDSLTFTIFSKNDLMVFKSNFNQLSDKKRFEFYFDGTHQGKEIPEGNLTAVFSTEDWAGNQKRYSSLPVKLVRALEKVTLTTATPAFAPNNNGYFDILTFNLSASSQTDLLDWEMKILDGEKSIYAFTGKGYLPTTLFYEGQNKAGQPVPDGEYQALLTVKYLSGNNPASEKISFIIDKTPPQLNVSIENQDQVFLPKAEKNNVLKVKQLSMEREPKSYTGVIAAENGDHVYYQEFGDSLPEKFNWDGKNEKGMLVTGSHTYSLLAEDSLGNKSEITSQPFRVIDELANIFIQANTSAFSPNGDNEKEKVTITVGMKEKDQERVQQQDLTIYSKKTAIRKISSPRFQAEYQWDGKNNNGKKVRDGKYQMRVKAQLTGGEITESSPLSVYVDTEPIEVALKVSEKIFSPNQDGRKESVTITQLKKESTLGDNKDKMTSFLIDEKGVTHRKNTWSGNLPKSLRWKGTDQNKAEAPEGIYTYTLETVDHAGNKKSFATKPFKLVRKTEDLSLELNTNIFSHQTKKPVLVTPQFSSLEDFNSYSLVSINAQGEKKIINVETNEEGFLFDGFDKDNKKLTDGRYDFYLQSIYENGNIPTSEPIPFQIDSQGPEISIFSEPEFFSPDGDGENDKLHLNINVNDESKIDNSKVDIYRLREFDQKNKPFKQTLENYQQNENLIKSWDLGESSGNRLQWDGKNQEGRLAVESANDYQIFVSSTDIAGNTKVKRKTITVDILVEKIGEGKYRIIINSINFKFNSDKLIGNYKKTLDRLVSILNKFNEYRFIVTGHTDTTGQVPYNEKLSIKRAAAVYNYLVQKKMDKSRMTKEGKGELDPLISPERNEEDQRKNRRVEFYLIKNKE